MASDWFSEQPCLLKTLLTSNQKEVPCRQSNYNSGNTIVSKSGALNKNWRPFPFGLLLKPYPKTSTNSFKQTDPHGTGRRGVNETRGFSAPPGLAALVVCGAQAPSTRLLLPEVGSSAGRFPGTAPGNITHLLSRWPPRTVTRSSSGEVRIRVPTFFCSLF